MINRRNFLLENAPAAAFGFASAFAASPRAWAVPEGAVSLAVFQIVTIRLEFGTQVARLAPWIEKSLLPILAKHRVGPLGFFTVDVGPHIPAVVVIAAYANLLEWQAALGSITNDPDWKGAVADFEKEGPAFYREDFSLLTATSFCPAVKATAPGDPAHKIYELRIYQSPTVRQLGYLHDRFAGGEIEIFHKSGIHPVLYADTVMGPDRPNMAYLIPFESEAHREKAWAEFRANPDWQKLREESIRRGGEIVRNISNTILVPMGFSMLK